MKKQLIILLCIITAAVCNAQVGIGTIVPEALLDIKSSNQATPANNDGILIPKIDEFPLIDPTAAKDGLLIYASGSGSITKGYYYWDDTASSWISIGTGVDDIDFYEEGTTSAPNDITDDMYTMGNLGIGKSTADYKLDIEESAGGRGAFIHMTGTTDVTTYGLLSEFSNSGNGSHVGVFSRLLGDGNGDHRAIWGVVDGSGTGTHTGSYITMSGDGSGQTRGFVASISGNGVGSQRGTFVNIANTGNGTHYGGINFLQGDGDGSQLGLYNLLQGNGTGDHYGTWSDVQGTGDGDQYGTRNGVSNTGSGTHTGTYNILSGTGTGIQYGINTTIDNSGNGGHIGALSTLSGSGSGTHTGYQATLTGNGSGQTRAFVAGFSGSGDGDQLGVYINLGNTGDGWHTGTLNNLTGDGNGTQVGNHNVLDGNGTNTHYGVRSDLLGTGTGTQVGSRHRMFNTGSGDHFGVYTTLSGAGSGIQYGVNNEITNSSDGVHYGVYNSLTGSGIGDKYGSYTLINSGAGGTHFGVYSDVQKAGSFAGYFLGDVAADGNTLFVDASSNRVGVGTGTPAFTLDVVGDINTSGSILQSGVAYSFPDYVFESYFDGASEFNSAYKLMELDEIESFLKKNKHLPGVQSRADVLANGWNITEGVRTNLEKVEELFLYSIESHKRIIELSKENHTLKSQFKDQQVKIDALIKELMEIKVFLQNNLSDRKGGE